MLLLGSTAAQGVRPELLAAWLPSACPAGAAPLGDAIRCGWRRSRPRWPKARCDEAAAAASAAPEADSHLLFTK